ncbi:hypothetical protein K466DRAFT_664248 [Polyporus arcularius HHB13444]|uniref:Uncharacterized protein n=1 Tax=Polyporus arcularius HHB13444 TaxID=1314778 RepID=A0A5C3PC60_9APHY|nr:hypothetical protein K466DRAFT_664248 [Polyporus arcularius HHB13444]
MDPRKVNPTDKYNLPRGMEPFRSMVANNASRWEPVAQDPLQHDEHSHEDDPATTVDAIPADASVPSSSATYAFQHHGATPGVPGPVNMSYSASSVPPSGAVSAEAFPIVQYGNPLYYGVRHANPQYNAVFPPLPQPPPGYYLPSEVSATSSLSPPVFSPLPQSSALPSPATSRRSVSIPQATTARAGRGSSAPVTPSGDGWSAAHDPRRLPHGVDSVGIVAVIPGAYYVVDTGTLPPGTVTYPGAPGPGFFVPNQGALQSRTRDSSTGVGQPQFASAAQWRQPPYAHSSHGSSPAGGTPTWPSAEGFGDMGDMLGPFGAQTMGSASPQHYPVASGSGQTYPHPPFPGSHPAQNPDPHTSQRPQRKRGPSETSGEDVRGRPSRKTVKKRAGAVSGAEGGSSGGRDDRSWKGEGSAPPGAGMFSLHGSPPR